MPALNPWESVEEFGSGLWQEKKSRNLSSTGPIIRPNRCIWCGCYRPDTAFAGERKLDSRQTGKIRRIAASETQYRLWFSTETYRLEAGSWFSLYRIHRSPTRKKENFYALYPNPKGRGFTAWENKILGLMPIHIFFWLSCNGPCRQLGPKRRVAVPKFNSLRKRIKVRKIASIGMIKKSQLSEIN